LENGLSIIENPNPSRGSYGTWLGDDYTEEAILERILGKRIVQTKKKTPAQQTTTLQNSSSQQSHTTSPQFSPAPTTRRPILLIDIQAKLQQAHSPGFEHFATIYNLKEMARTLIYLNEKGIGTRKELDEKINEAKSGYNGRQGRIKEIEARQKEISELQRHIGTYSKKKDAYNEWQKLKKYQPIKWEQFRKT